MCSASSPSLRLSALLALAFNGQQVLFHKPLQLSFRQLAAQSVFLDVAGHIHPLDAALLVVVMVQLPKNLDGLLVHQCHLPFIGLWVAKTASAREIVDLAGGVIDALDRKS